MCALVRPKGMRDTPFSNRIETTMRGINGIQSMDNLRKARSVEKMRKEEEEMTQNRKQKEKYTSDYNYGMTEGFALNVGGGSRDHISKLIEDTNQKQHQMHEKIDRNHQELNNKNKQYYESILKKIEENHHTQKEETKRFSSILDVTSRRQDALAHEVIQRLKDIQNRQDEQQNTLGKILTRLNNASYDTQEKTKQMNDMARMSEVIH